MIFRRLPASSSFVLAAARLRALQLDPGRAAAGPGSCEEGHRRTVSPARTARVVIGPDPYALLTVVALMGAADRVERRGVLGRVLLASALGVLAKAGHGRARLRVPREVKGYSANVLASSLGLDPRHYRLRPDARQRHVGSPVVERIRLGGRQVLEQPAAPVMCTSGTPSDRRAITLAASSGTPRVPGLGLQEPAGELAQSGRPGLGRVQDDLDVHAGTLTTGTGISASSGATRFRFCCSACL